ncbi:MAG: 50S ribosomal protein L35 [Herpetosiphon sp.]
MPKMKTHKGAQKRFKITGTGKLMMPKGGKSHFRRRRSRRVKQQLDKMHEMSSANSRRLLKRVIPYGL